jgi:PhzF family phenazine biosynthesis protein
MNLYWVDAFTSRPFTGNPAAVVPLAAWPGDERLQRIAFENGLSETAFFVRTGPSRFHLRWFTPALEVDLCGHATLATAQVLFTELGEAGPVLTFDTRSGPLTVARRTDGRLELDFPALPAAPCATPPAAVLATLDRAPREILQVPGKDRFLAVYASEADVRALRPDFAALARLGDTRVIATAPGDEADCASRFFAPGAGVPEDPVTGSAHCTIVPYWAARLGRTHLRARQVSARGGELACTLEGDRVRLAGDAVLYLRGEILV